MMNKKELENRIIEVIKTIYDPEIPVNIYELGLIYDVNVNDENMVKILMTLTTPNCPCLSMIMTLIWQEAYWNKRSSTLTLL